MPFRDVVGHRRLITLLSRAVQRGTLPPSLIFAGPQGIGKRLVALATAQALNCPNSHGRATADGDVRPSRRSGRSPELGAHSAPARERSGAEGPRERPSRGPGQSPGIEEDACGVCPTCTRIERGTHPDVLVVEPGETGSIKIDRVRAIVDTAGYRPFEGIRRAVIIDEADALVPQAQNALLKTLEEPPPSSVFLLVTSRPDMLLPTVLSRCPRLRFRQLAADDVAAVLVKKGRSDVEARAAAAAAGGSVGRALEANTSELVEACDVAERVLALAAATDDPRRRLEGAKDLLERTGGTSAGDRDSVATHLKVVASLVRDIELLSTSADSRALANPDLLPAIQRLTAFRGERGLRAFTTIDRALEALDRNAGVKVVADWVMLQL